MSDGKGKNALLLGSVAANIFLVAFTIGRWSAPGMMPPPPMMFAGHEQAMHGAPGEPPPWMNHGERGDLGPEGRGGPGMPPPPPMFGPDDVFSPQEMQQNMQEMQQSFEKVQGLRKNFAAKVEKGPVTKEEVLQHFADIDAVMGSVKGKVQEKTAEKISTMSDDDRKKFAARLKEHCDRPPHGGPGEHGPDGGPGNGPDGDHKGPPPGGGPDGHGPDGAGGPPPDGGPAPQ